MAEQDDLERTEAPSLRRLVQAREEGQVPRSRELATFTLLAAAGIAAIAGSDHWRDGLSRVLRAGLAFDRRLATDPAALGDYALSLATDGLLVALPLLGVAFVAGVGGTLAVGGWNFTTRPLVPRLARLDPGNGVRNVFSVHGAGELAKAVLKALAVGALVAWLLWRRSDDIALLSAASLPVALAAAGGLLTTTFLMLVGAMALIAAFDVPVQLLSHFRRLRMSRAELRQEHRELEGDPQLKARIRRLQRERARRRMMAAIPTADVVVTNPTHFAVALKYDESMAAPQVIAKGADVLARRIREIAAEHRVPIVEAAPLARALYRHTELGEQIPAPLFEAVAAVLAYVFQLRDALARGRQAPTPPGDLPVPDALDPGAVPEVSA
jgi:flagellar biosynthetic protein FlhB